MKQLKQIALIAIFAAMAAPAAAQFDNVGSINFPTSVTGEAQQHFLRGVAVLHSFGWEQAQEQFRAAQEIEPDFAMAYWGETLSYNHPLFSGMDPTEPPSVEDVPATHGCPIQYSHNAAPAPSANAD